jgi:hypothetical protein
MQGSPTMDRPDERVAALLTEQRDMYRQLSRLADQQRGLITGNETERLLAVLAERQRLVERLTATGRELKPLQANWSSVRDSLSPQQAGDVDALVGEVKALLTEILERDEADTALLSARKSETSQAMGTLQVSRRAGTAYAASVGAAGQSSGMDWTQA